VFAPLDEAVEIGLSLQQLEQHGGQESGRRAQPAVLSTPASAP
jgi:hypothetical protein